MCFVNTTSIEAYLANCKDQDYKLNDKNKKAINSMKRQVAQEINDNPVLKSGNVKEISDAIVEHRKQLLEETECISDDKGRRKHIVDSQMHSFKKELIRGRVPSHDYCLPVACLAVPDLHRRVPCAWCSGRLSRAVTSGVRCGPCA